MKANFLKRYISSFVFLVIMFGAILLSKYTFFMLLLFIGMGCMWEYFGLVRKFAQPNRWLGLIYGAILFLLGFYFLFFFDFIDLRFLVGFAIILVLLTVAMFVVELFRNKGNIIANVGVTVLGIVYIIFPMLFMAIIGYNPYTETYNSYLVLAIFFGVWVYDVAAFLLGNAVGGKKLMPSVSEGKTISGCIFGIIYTVIYGIILTYFNVIFYSYLEAVTITFFIAVFGIIGDLCESKMKREAGVKDSGNIMPGHGGFLDRFDSILLTIPVICILLIIFRM